MWPCVHDMYVASRPRAKKIEDEEPKMTDTGTRQTRFLPCFDLISVRLAIEFVCFKRTSQVIESMFRWRWIILL